MVSINPLIESLCVPPALVRLSNFRCKLHKVPQTRSLLYMLLSIWLTVSAILLFFVKIISRRCRNPGPHIHGAFVVPGYPFVGNTFQVLNNPSKTFMEWSRKYHQSTFVIHLGPVPVLIVNGRKEIEYLWNRHSTALNSRPTLYTFHKVVSSTQGPTIGTTPAGVSFRLKRKIISLHLSTRSLSVDEYSRSIDQCSHYIVTKMLWKVKSLYPMQPQVSDVSLLRDFQCYVLRCAIELMYGIPLDTHGQDRELADQIIETENHIINFRSFIANYQDYLPIFNTFPFNTMVNSEAEAWKGKRDEYIDEIQSKFERNLHDNVRTSSTSILARIMSEKADARMLTHQEARSLCLTMISAGLDNLGFTMNHIIGHFSSSPTGYKMQQTLYVELVTSSKNDLMKAWDDAAAFITCDYALAIIQEALRHLSVLPLGLPRLTTKPLDLGKISIPQNTVVFMNAYAANHDPQAFKDPDTFSPERWLDEHGKIINSNALCHYTFGLGSRKCAGDQLSVREMYTLLCRLVLVFHIRKPRDPKWVMELDPFLSNSKPTATSLEPREFRVWLRARQGEGVFELHRHILGGAGKDQYISPP